jgi:hypothetical protein
MYDRRALDKRRRRGRGCQKYKVVFFLDASTRRRGRVTKGEEREGEEEQTHTYAEGLLG